MHHGEELLILGILFLIAHVLGRLGRRIGLPAIPIYMVVGLVASPYTPWFPLSVESESVELIAIFGLILLLFNLGLEFDQDEFFSNFGRLLLSGGSYVLINMAIGIGFGFLVGWGAREALVIAGMTATSSSAIVTKLLIELGRLANNETPTILGVTVIEDIFIAIYLAIVSVVLSGETAPGPVILQLVIAFAFIVAMFAVARWGGRFVSRLFRTRDDELFTVLFFGLAVTFGGIGELLGVTDAIGAFLIGLVLGASRHRDRIERMSLPLRDLFAAFFFLNFGLALDPGQFGGVLVPVLAAVFMTFVLNVLAGQFVAWLNKLGPQAGINTAAILVNRGEFAIILATLGTAAGLDDRIVPFAGLYVLITAVLGPLFAENSERIGGIVLRRRRRAMTAARAQARVESDDAIALVEAADRDDDEPDAPGERRVDGVGPETPGAERPAVARETGDGGSAETADEPVDATREPADATVTGGADYQRMLDQAMQQSDEPRKPRQRDPEY